jgi:hypothetical protein
VLGKKLEERFGERGRGMVIRFDDSGDFLELAGVFVWLGGLVCVGLGDTAYVSDLWLGGKA